MKCEKCGAELSDDSRFCSYCGSKITVLDVTDDDDATAVNITDDDNTTDDADDIDDVDDVDGNAAHEETVKKYKFQTGDVKKPYNSLWSRLDTYEKISVVAIVIFVIFCLIAFLRGKTIAGTITIVQIGLIIVAILIRKEFIKVPQKWIYVILFAFAFALLLPYMKISSIDYGNAQKFGWNDIIMSNVIPETKSHFGEILTNSESNAILHIYKTNPSQYNNYISDCKDMGFTIDAEETSTSFCAYDSVGNDLSIYYNESKNLMIINVQSAKEYSALIWPQTGMANLLPTPVSTKGEIIQDDTSLFCAYVSNTSISEFEEYLNSCIENGFINGVSKSDKSYSAQDNEGYRLELSYEGNNVISIILEEPEYEISIEIECIENWFFSKYDVNIYIDNSQIGTVKHGTTENLTVNLTKGTYKVQFVDVENSNVTGEANINVSGNETFKFKISCTSSVINVEAITNNIADEASAISESTNMETTDNTDENILNQPETSVIVLEDSSSDVVEQEEATLSYSTNTKDTVKNGNSGIYSYKNSGSEVSNYWIIDFDEGYVYHFLEGNGDTTCERVQIDYGDLNTHVIITYDDGYDTWSYALYFKWKNQPGHMVLQDNIGFEYDYYTTNLDSALAIRDKRTIVDY